MSVKNTSIGQLLSYGALALAGHQAYRYFRSKGQAEQGFREQDTQLDRVVEGSLLPSDPMPLSRDLASGIH